VNCARGELIDVDALRDALKDGKVAGAGLDVFEQEPPGEIPLFALDSVLATPHIAGSTEEAQEIVGIRIAEQVAEYLKSGVALNAVNMPALTAEQYKALGPFVDLAERLGQFLSHIAEGNIHTIRVIYSGRLAESNTEILRNASLAGVLSRSVEYRVNLVNAMPLATERGFRIIEQREPTLGGMDSIRMELETQAGSFSVVGALVLNKPRLLQVENISCEATLDGNLMYSKNEDVPGVIGYLGSSLGENGINIANFALGRQELGSGDGTDKGPLMAISIIETDQAVPDGVVNKILRHSAVKLIRRVTLSNR
jgi:D-3-phosphoglycerate dehydrogenase